MNYEVTAYAVAVIPVLLIAPVMRNPVKERSTGYPSKVFKPRKEGRGIIMKIISPAFFLSLHRSKYWLQ